MHAMSSSADSASDLSEETSPLSERRLIARSGASVSIAERDGIERIEVRDAQARLVFELDPVTGIDTAPRPMPRSESTTCLRKRR